MEYSMSARDVAKKFSSAIEAMDFPAAFSLLAEDGKYIVIGTTKVSRTYNGRADLFENLIPVLGTCLEPPVLTFEEPIVDGDRVVMLASGAGVGPTGPYDQPYYAFVARVEGDGFSEVIEFMDTKMLETAFFGD
jgi:ketosteroid isomerase-like protein